MERAVPRRRQLLVLTLAFAGCDPLEGASAAALEGECASCHPAQAEEHAVSRHARAGRSEVFTALRQRVEDPAFCDTCHREIGCLECHSAIGNEGVQNGLMLWDRDGPVRGPTGIAPGAPHATRRSEYLESSDLCGTCHEVAGPAGFSEAPYTHWLSSPAAARNLACSNCHATHRREARYGEGVRLALADGRLTIDHSEGGHHFPDGASFLREIDVVLRSAGAEVARIPLGAELALRGAPVVLPTDADRVVLRGVEAGTVHVAEARGADTACIEVRRFRPELLRALGLPEDETVQSHGCVD